MRSDSRSAIGRRKATRSIVPAGNIARQSPILYRKSSNPHTLRTDPSNSKPSVRICRNAAVLPAASSSVKAAAYRAGSAPVVRPGSLAAEVADCGALLEVLKVGSARVLGMRHSAAIALNLASASPEAVRTLTMMETRPLGIPSATKFLAVCAGLSETFHAKGSPRRVG